MKCIDIKRFTDEKSGLDISIKSRERTYLMYRSFYYYACLLYSEDGFDLNSIGKSVNQRYTAVNNGLKRFYEYCETDRKFSSFVHNLKEELLKHFDYKDDGFLLKLEPFNELLLKKKLLELTGKLNLAHQEIKIQKSLNKDYIKVIKSLKSY